MPTDVDVDATKFSIKQFSLICFTVSVGPTCHQSHRPGHRAVNVQPGCVAMPPLADDDRDERDGQGSLP